MIIFLSISLNMCFVCSKEPSHQDGSFEYPQHMFWLRNNKNNFQLHTLIWGTGMQCNFACFFVGSKHFLTLILPLLFIPRRSRRDIVLASCVRACVRPSGFISQYLLVRFDSFVVQMISTMNSRYPISLVKIDPLTLELLPLF